MKAETVATAIKIGDPASFDRAVEAIRYTNGVVTSVTDAEILDAKAVVDASGVGCEPASAASVAGVRRLVREGVIRRVGSRRRSADRTRAEGSRAPCSAITRSSTPPPRVRESAGRDRGDDRGG